MEIQLAIHLWDLGGLRDYSFEKVSLLFGLKYSTFSFNLIHIQKSDLFIGLEKNRPRCIGSYYKVSFSRTVSR